MVAGIGNVTPNAHQGVWQRSKAGGLSLPSQGESRGELQFEALMRMLDNKVANTLPRSDAGHIIHILVIGARSSI